jgi:hypothetical protein
MTVITRRGLIQMGAAVAASTAAVTEAPAFGRPRSIEFGAMLAVAGSSDAQVFARAAQTRGMRVYRVGNDMTEVYVQRPWLAEPPMAVGGLTRAAQLFIMERTAWDVGMRVVFLGRHAVHRGAPAHALKGPDVAVNRFYGSVRLIDWRIAIARTLIEVPRGTPALKPLSAVRDAVIEGDPALFSWVIAPVSATRGVSV